jgi:hypothetical protein
VLAYDTEAIHLPPAPVAAMATAAPALPAPPAPTVLPHAAQAATIVNTAGPPLPAAAVPTASAPPKTLAPARQAAARPQGTKPAAVPGDSDVALLTAMVAHAHRQEGSVPPVRDVVLRRQEQGKEQGQGQEQDTAELLRRCQQLGLIEGMLCRSRICSGRWDSDPACH